MYRPHLVVGMLWLAGYGLGQPATSQTNPISNLNPRAYTPDIDNRTYSQRTYNQPGVTYGSGNWGWLGVLGLAGLAGRRSVKTLIRDPEQSLTDQRRNQYTILRRKAS